MLDSKSPAMNRRARPLFPATRPAGLGLAALTAVVSGTAVFVNRFGVQAWQESGGSGAYTTAKNLVAALLLVAALGVVRARKRPSPVPRRPAVTSDRALLALVAVIGGSVPFLLFFEGLARATSTQAAFLHKTLLIWVALLAVPFLRERLTRPHLVALGLLIGGQLALAGGLPEITWGGGEAMILAATLLWSVEGVLDRRLLAVFTPLQVGVARMAGGAALLLAWGAFAGPAIPWASLGGEQIAWAVVTGGLLFGYVATWMGALARAQAVDVTAVLVGGALITAALDAGFGTLALGTLPGLALIGLGVAVVLASSRTPMRTVQGTT